MFAFENSSGRMIECVNIHYGSVEIPDVYTQDV